MAKENVAQSTLIIENVLNAIEEREEQLYAMATSILFQLSPADEKSIPEGHPLTAWRLAQLLDDMLSSTSHRNYVRNTLERLV